MLALHAKDLVVGARIDGAMVPAIRALSFDLAPGKILGLVGESGAGKSMVGRAIAQLLPSGFAITSGSLLFEGDDLVRMAPGARRALLGRAIAFIPQAPMTSLNPVRTIGAQFDEHLARLGERSRGARRDRAVAMLTAARLPRAAELFDAISASIVRRHVPACADRAWRFPQIRAWSSPTSRPPRSM